MNRLESRTRNRKVVSSSLEPAGIVGGGSECSALSTLNTTAEVPLCKAPNPQLLPGCRSINGCPLLWVCVHSVCVHFGWVNAEHEFRVWVTKLGHMSRHFHNLKMYRFSTISHVPHYGNLSRKYSTKHYIWKLYYNYFNCRRVLTWSTKHSDIQN